MQITSVKLTEDSEHLADHTISDYSMLGYVVNKDATMIDLFYYFICEENERFLIKQSFLINQEKRNDELEYLSAPINQLSNISKYNDVQKKAIESIMRKCDKDNSMYSDFSMIDSKDGYVTFVAFVITIDHKMKHRFFKVPYSIYIRLSRISCDFIFNNPINPNLDSDTNYDRMTILDIKSINYLGVGKNNIALMSFDIGDKKIGAIMPFAPKKDKIISKEYDMKAFISAYKSTVVVNRINLLLFNWKRADGSIKPTIAILYNYKLYVTDDSLNDSILLNPYSKIYY